MIAPLRRNSSARFRALCAIAALTGFGQTVRAEIIPSEWKYQQTLDVPHAGLTKLSLPDSTLDHARAGLADLRILGPDGEEIPYLIEAPAPPAPAVQAPRNTRIELQPLSTQLIIETGTDLPIERIALSTPARDFVKAARLEVSSDGRQWELSGEGFPLARQAGLNALTLPLSNVSAAYLRITIDDSRSATVPFTGAVLHLAAAEALLALPVPAEISKREEFAGETLLTLQLPGRHLPLASLELGSTDRLFARTVSVVQRVLEGGTPTEQSLGSGSIFRSRLPQKPLREHLQVRLNSMTMGPEIQVRITNGDSAPLTIERVRVWRRPVWIIFHAVSPGTHRLLSGNARIAAANYDVVRFTSEWQATSESSLVLSRPQTNPGYQPADPLADTPLLGAALDVSRWKFRKEILLRNPGVQELELDGETLAHAKPDLADLRVLRDGKQIPYLLERTSLSQRAVLAPNPTEDPPQPQISRWILALPLEGLPVQRLVLTSSTPLFSRTLRVFEKISDRRGEIFQRGLTGMVEWSSTPDQPRERVTVELLEPPRTGTLYLETNDGDNLPISLSTAWAEYPVV